MAMVKICPNLYFYIHPERAQPVKVKPKIATAVPFKKFLLEIALSNTCSTMICIISYCDCYSKPKSYLTKNGTVEKWIPNPKKVL